MNSTPTRRLLAVLFGIAVSIFVTCFVVVAGEVLTRALTKNGAAVVVDGLRFHDSFEYVTIGDPDIGFALRPGIQSRWDGPEIFINRSGVRDSRRDRVVAAKAEDELLVLILGDSNAFGHFVRYEDTYAARLERLLAALTPRSVRVVNLGVSGHTNLQAMLTLERWLHLDPDVVVFADSFNNRVEGTPQHQVSEQMLSKVCTRSK